MVWEDIYLPFRPTTMQWISRYNSIRIMNTLATRFEENCKNHIAVNFERRLNKWFKYKINNKTSLEKPQRSVEKLAKHLSRLVINRQQFSVPNVVGPYKQIIKNN